MRIRNFDNNGPVLLNGHDPKSENDPDPVRMTKSP